ncbi:MAG: aspartate aminotransferase family protein [Verrucomicrobia bacterium]|nr:aspartate aminotransferase family protein [Verrucomicrobiota bacterium]
MPIDIKKLVADRLGENYTLHERHVNSTLVRVLRTIGFDKVYARAKGQYLWDKEGNQYLDYLSGYGVFNIGRNHPGVAQAIRDVLDLDLPNMVQMDCAFLSGVMAEQLLKRCPPHLNAVFFCNSGTESVEGALKFAKGATGRPRLVYLNNSFHGLTLGALSVNGAQSFREGFEPLLPGCVKIEMNDLEALERELSKRDVAAFIFECCQGKMLHVPHDGFLAAAQALCRKYGTLTISDEVQTGMGRTGKMFGFQHWNLEPDIITLAKSLSGGYVPIGAFVTRREIYQKVFSRLDRCVVHSTTFGRNNLAMACGLATLAIFDEENIIERGRKLSEFLFRELNALKAKHNLIKEVRGLGLMIGVEFREPSGIKAMLAWKAIHAADKALFPQIVVSGLLKKHRILAQVAAHGHDIVKILPPLVSTEEDARAFVNALDDVLGDCDRVVGPMLEFGQSLAKAALASKQAAS